MTEFTSNVGSLRWKVEFKPWEASWAGTDDLVCPLDPPELINTQTDVHLISAPRTATMLQVVACGC